MVGYNSDRVVKMEITFEGATVLLSGQRTQKPGISLEFVYHDNLKLEHL